MRKAKQFYRHYESCKKPLYDLTQYLNYKGIKTNLISIPLFFMHFIWFSEGAPESIRKLLNMHGSYFSITPNVHKSDIMVFSI